MFKFFLNSYLFLKKVYCFYTIFRFVDILHITLGDFTGKVQELNEHNLIQAY